jgi:AraC-like DNA-binding protein
VAVIKILIKHAQSIKESFSSIEKMNLHWLMLIISGFTVILFFGFLLDALRVTLISWDAVWLMIALFMYMIGYMGLRQPEIFTDMGELKQAAELQNTKKKYEKSTLTPETADLYFKKLISFMETEKPFLNSNLTLPELANCITIPVHHLSQVINEKLSQNFFEFINSYRVEEAKKRLIAPEYQNYNILSIGLDSGFNSVSAFNAAFKKIAKITPSQYRNENLRN